MDYSLRHGCFRVLLRRVREEAGLSQAALAEKLGKPQTFVSKSELGERRIDFLETLDFCTACGVSIANLAHRLKEILSGTETELEQRAKRRSPRKMDSKGRLTRSG